MDALITQRCYICSAYFADKVKLGLHIAVCYSDAVKRGVRDLPPPTDLLNDEKRYTEYMRDHHKQLQAEIDAARRQKVSFVTANDFSAMRTQLEHTPKPDSHRTASSPVRVAAAAPTAKPRAVASGPQSPERGVSRGSEDLHQNPAYRFRRGAPEDCAGGVIGGGGTPSSPLRAPVRTVAEVAPTVLPPTTNRVSTGVTMLRSELANELDNVRCFLEEEKRKAAERDAMFQAQAPAVLSPLAVRPSSTPAGLPRPTANRPIVVAPPSIASPEVGLHDQQQCPSCGKYFGRKGYAVHTARCGMHATEDFTFSRDAERPEGRREHQIPDEPTRCDPTSGKPMSAAQWKQFMVTYPRPVLEEAPRPAGYRPTGNQAPYATNEESKVPCSQCGRFFYASRVGQHEAVCVANLRR